MEQAFIVGPNNFNIDGYDLVCTCYACPEQYDVYFNGERVGYLRLRHGHFTAEVPGPFDNLVYGANPMGDGIFEDDERELYLRKAIRAINNYRTTSLRKNID